LRCLRRAWGRWVTLPRSSPGRSIGKRFGCGSRGRAGLVFRGPDARSGGRGPPNYRLGGRGARNDYAAPGVIRPPGCNPAKRPGKALWSQRLTGPILPGPGAAEQSMGAWSIGPAVDYRSLLLFFPEYVGQVTCRTLSKDGFGLGTGVFWLQAAGAANSGCFTPTKPDGPHGYGPWAALRSPCPSAGDEAFTSYGGFWPRGLLNGRATNRQSPRGPYLHGEMGHAREPDGNFPYLFLRQFTI